MLTAEQIDKIIAALRSEFNITTKDNVKPDAVSNNHIFNVIYDAVNGVNA